MSKEFTGLDEVYQDFFTDHQTKRVLDSSEVWQNYSQAELARDQIRQKRALEESLDTENAVLAGVQQLRMVVESNPKLKANLKRASLYLKAHPEEMAKVDPNFINGLSLLNLSDDEE